MVNYDLWWIWKLYATTLGITLMIVINFCEQFYCWFFFCFVSDMNWFTNSGYAIGLKSDLKKIVYNE